MHSDGREVTNWIFGAGDIAANPASLFSGKVSNDNMIAVSDALIIKFAYALLKDNFERFASLNTIRAGILERYIVDYQESLRTIRYDSAVQQLTNYQKRCPKLFYAVPLLVLASFFGFSKTSFMRLRRCKFLFLFVYKIKICTSEKKMQRIFFI